MITTSYHPNVSDDSVKLLTRCILLLIPKRDRKYKVEVIVAAILHRIDNGCKWRALDRPELPWYVAYDYYKRWASNFVIETANAMLVSMLRFLEALALTMIGAPGPDHNSGSPTLAVVDSKSVRSAVWGRREDHGFDGFKHVKGIKVHALTDSRGHLLACSCSQANAHDWPHVAQVLARAQAVGFSKLVKCLADGAYKHFGEQVAELDSIGVHNCSRS